MISLEGAKDSDNRLASFLAIHLVSQVLDEAYIIASEAKDSGEPWHYLSMLKTFKAANLDDTDEDDSYVSKSGKHASENEHSHIVATSTPQKDFDANKKPKTEGNFIGQGDEDLDMPQSDQSQISSTLINNIFDMSEVTRVEASDDTIQDNLPPNSDIITAIATMMDYYVDKACKIVDCKNFSNVEAMGTMESDADTKQEDYNDHSFLADVFGSDLGNNVAFYLDDVSANNDIRPEELPEALVDDDGDDNKSAPPDGDQLHLHLPTMNDTALYNIDAYLTLNRDYEQCSDDDADPILQDPKGLSMHEITLLTANTSLQDLSSRPDLGQEPKQLIDAATSDISESIPPAKKTLARRCRLQGARILACLRGWWRRRTPSKSKQSRVPDFLRDDACPFSPESRRRRSATLSTSLVEPRRDLNSPEPSRDTWKFNTVSEALLNVSQWKEYVYMTLKGDEKVDADDTIDAADP